jgi:predicted ATPase
MLTAIHPVRFKATFKPGDISLGPITAFVGRNGSGKSTVLEALQWVSSAVRFGVAASNERWFGGEQLVNLRGKSDHFAIELVWDNNTRYHVHLVRRKEGVVLDHEWFRVKKTYLIGMAKGRPKPGRLVREISLGDSKRPVTSRDTLALGVADKQTPEAFKARRWLERAVFLRLSPQVMAAPGAATYQPRDPRILDEEGRLLPALLRNLDKDALARVLRRLQDVLPDIRGLNTVDVFGPRPQAYVSIGELMPNRGRSGTAIKDLPLWYVSEGIRRLIALFAVLEVKPAPSVVCVEEIENGLDPFTVETVVRYLRSMADRKTQVLITSHSPYLLDFLKMDEVIFVDRQGGDSRYQRAAESSEAKRWGARLPPGSLFVSGLRRK